VLKWVIQRLEGTAVAEETAIGRVPTADSLDTEGLDMTAEDLATALAVDPAEWREELPQIEEWFRTFGDQLPTLLLAELDALKARLGVV
jgi:phosphoenolpyruvate carboxykinase (GTP)